MIVTEDTTMGQLREALNERGAVDLNMHWNVQAQEWVVRIAVSQGGHGERRAPAYTGHASMVIAISQALHQLDEDRNAERSR